MAAEGISSRFRIKTTPVIQDIAKVSPDSKHEREKEEKEQNEESPPREQDTLELTATKDNSGDDVPEKTDVSPTKIVPSPPQIGGKLNIILR